MISDNVRIIAEVKPLLGKSFTDEDVQKFDDNHMLKMISVANKPVFKVTHNGKVCIK